MAFVRFVVIAPIVAGLILSFAATARSSQPDTDGDGVIDEAELNCGGDPLDASVRPELANGFDDNADTVADEPLPPSAPAYDCDGDGYAGSVEAQVFGATGRDKVQCGNYGWPTELVASGASNNKVDLLDLSSFIAPVRYFGTNVGNNPGDIRWNIEPRDIGPGPDINLIDLSNLITVRPSMFGQERAFNGATCDPVACAAGTECCRNIPSYGIRVCASTDKLVYQLGELVKLRLSVVNITGSHLTFYSNDGCLADFFVGFIWDSIYGRGCSDAITPVSLSPGQVRHYVQSWDQRDNFGQQVPRGEYEVYAAFSVEDCGGPCYSPWPSAYFIQLVP